MTEEVVSYDGGALVSGVEGVEERHQEDTAGQDVVARDTEDLGLGFSDFDGPLFPRQLLYGKFLSTT